MPGSRPNEYQQLIIDDWGKIPTQAAVAGNQSGKSTLGARLSAWFLEESKPGWERPAKWGGGALMGMLVGRTMKQVEEQLLRSIQGYFDPEELWIPKVGMIPQKVVHRRTGNTILLASHHNEAEAREKLQAFVLHFVWLDEMPRSSKLFEELERRVQSKDGLFLSTFTPKVKNLDIRKTVDAYAAPFSRKYAMPMFANPSLSVERRAKILQELEAYPEAYRNCVLNGDWLDDDLAVYNVPDTAVRKPEGYQSTWRHVEGADPALQSKHGHVVWAEQPDTGHWYMVRAEYVSGIPVPEDLIRTVIEKTRTLNVVRRVCDSASTWYIGQASKMGHTYVTPWDKNNRRPEMMKNMQSRLGKDCFIAPWCSDFTMELTSMQWSETAADRVVNQHVYHLHDAAMYSIDCLPKPDGGKAPVPELHVRLRMLIEKDRKAAARPQGAAQAGPNRILKPYRIRRRW